MSLAADLILPQAASTRPGQNPQSTPKGAGQSGFAGIYSQVREGAPAADGAPASAPIPVLTGQPATSTDEQILAELGNALPPANEAPLAEPDQVSLEELLFGRADVTGDAEPNAAMPAPETEEAPEVAMLPAQASNTQAATTPTIAAPTPPPGTSAATATAEVVAQAAAVGARATEGSGARNGERQPLPGNPELIAEEAEAELRPRGDEREFSQSLRASTAAAAALAASSAASADTPDSPVNPLTQAMQQAAAQREAAAAAQQQPLPLRQPGMSEALVERVMWLSSQNLRSAEIQLDPAELGRLEIRNSLNQEQAHVSFVSPHASVREALEGQMHRLREMFAQQGLDQLDVNVSDQSLARGERDAEEGGPTGLAGHTLDADGEPEGETVVASTPLDSGRGLVDFYA